MKWNTLSLFHRNHFLFGERPITQYVIFEWKPLFSLIIFHFHSTLKEQDRYHTHAFSSLSLKLKGYYEEHILDPLTLETTVQKRTQLFKYFPRNRFHKIGRSNDCWTLLLSGPWKPTWKEQLSDGSFVEYSWNRKLTR